MAVTIPVLERQRQEDPSHSQANKLSLLGKLQTSEKLVSKTQWMVHPRARTPKVDHLAPTCTHMNAHSETNINSESLRNCEGGRLRV